MSRPLAKRYVAIVRGRPTLLHGHTEPRRRVFAGPVKREAFRDAKSHAVRWYHEGATVELRAGTTRGPIVDRVKLKHAGARHRWLPDFET